MPRELRRSITLLHSTALVAGIIIGASIFVQPSIVAGTVHTVPLVYAVWIAAGILTLFGALITAELASAYPRAGGVYDFLKESFSPGVAFLWGWAMFWTMHTGIVAALAMVFARYASYFLSTGDTGQRLLAIAAIVVLSAANYFGVRQGSLLQTSLTIAKVLAIVAIIAAAFFFGPRAPVATLGNGATVGTALRTHLDGAAAFDPRLFATALFAALFAFGGWHMVTYAAEETREPEKTIPRALFAGVVIVTVCYVALNAAYFHLLPLDAVAKSTRVAADAANAIFGTGGAAFMSAVVVVSILGSLSGVILAGPRVYMSMARDGLLFKWAGAVHESYRTPHRAIIAQALWAAVLVATGSYRALVSRVVYTEWIFFALMTFGLMRLRHRATYAPAYRVWGYPLTPVVFIVSSLYIVANEIISEPVQSVSGLLLVGAGWPIYYFLVRKPRPSTDSTTNAD
jgi:basic amino acid/polyamine antiporter, APA family